MSVKTLLLAGSLALAGCGGSEPRTVPDLRGDRLDVAEERLDDLGLEYDEVGGGAFGIVVRSNWEVCDQKPRPGARAAKVQLIVDRAGTCPPRPARVAAVPDLVGKSLAQADAQLKAKKISRSRESWDGEPVDREHAVVCEQEPGAGEKAGHVTLYVARECEPKVPDVVGEDLEDAEDVLGDDKIRVRVVGFRGKPADKAFWIVCEQEPDAGETADAVTVYVKRRC
jgi:beta-lactam-binding protein with PASTA domain